MRQVGSALGIAVLGTVVTTQTINHAVSRIGRTTLSAATKRAAVARVHALGANYSPTAASPPAVAKALTDAVAHAVATASRDAILIAGAVVIVGTLLSLLIPTVPLEARAASTDEQTVLTAVEPEAVIGAAAGS
jgi:hypothetical protein